MVEQQELTKGRAALVLLLSAAVAAVSATMLHGWHVYVGLAIAGVAAFFAFLRCNRSAWAIAAACDPVRLPRFYFTGS